MKLALFDVDEVIITGKRNGKINPNLAYYKRLALWKPIIQEKYGIRPGEIKLTSQDTLDLKETTDLGTLCLYLTPLHYPRKTYYQLDRTESDVIKHNAYQIIQSSIAYYFRLLDDRKRSPRLFNPDIEIKTMRGITDLLNQLELKNWHMHVASGNPVEMAIDKLQRANVFSKFTPDPEHDSLTPGPGNNPHLILDGTDYVTRDRMVMDYFDYLKPDTAIYFGDRLSDIGLVERLHDKFSYFRGIIFPSFDRSHLNDSRIIKLKQRGIVMFVEDLPTQLESVLRFTETQRSNLEFAHHSMGEIIR